MESLKDTIKHIAAIPYRLTPEEPFGVPRSLYETPERGVILHDTISNEACMVPFGKKVDCNNLDDLYVDMGEDWQRCVTGARTSLAEYTAYYCGVDLLACADDIDVYGALEDELGCAVAGWISDISCDRLTHHPSYWG